jgi:hypothetical protein
MIVSCNLIGYGNILESYFPCYQVFGGGAHSASLFFMVCLRAGKLSGINAKGGGSRLFLSRGYQGILWRENEWNIGGCDMT